jgi:hypothetical protein
VRGCGRFGVGQEFHDPGDLVQLTQSGWDFDDEGVALAAAAAQARGAGASAAQLVGQV